MTANKKIIALSDFEHVLTRPTMYVGSLEASEEKVQIVRDDKIINDIKEISVGFYKMMNEILDNAFDEAKRQKGLMKRIEIHFYSKDNRVKVVDTGGGFINASHLNEKTGVSNVETAMTMLRAGSNFYNDTTAESLLGTNGVGASVVNMLADNFTIRTVNAEEIYEQTWEKFISVNTVNTPKKPKDETGTVISFTPRKDKFKNCKWDKEYIHTLMLFKQFLKKHDPEISNLEFLCFYDDQPLDVNAKFLPDDVITVENRYGSFFLWESYPQGGSVSFVNSAQCTGIHQRILLDHVNSVYENPLAGRFYESFIMLNLPPKYVSFGDQNKTRFVTSRNELSPLLEKNFFPGIKREIRNSSIYDNILRKISEAERDSDMRNLKTKKRVQKSKISDKYFPPSMKTKNLYIVEGGSAMGSILQKRDPKIDAVYALKGKIKNARRLSDLTSNMEIIDLMNILGIEPDNDRNCKYERIVISADADPDGLGHIASLVINLFFKWFPNVILQGKLFILQTPLLSVDEAKKKKYFFTMKEFEAYSRLKKPAAVRYLKGLGSLSREDWEHVFGDMRLLKITEDKNSSKMMDIAFGSNAGLRKKWLQN